MQSRVCVNPWIETQYFRPVSSAFYKNTAKFLMMNNTPLWNVRELTHRTEERYRAARNPEQKLSDVAYK